MEKAVALVSGGLKSAVMVAAERDRCDLLLLYVGTGSRASAAEEAACAHLCAKWNVLNRIVVPAPHLLDAIDHPWFKVAAAPEEIQASADVLDGYVPGLMPALLDIAVLHALRAGIRRLLVGACEYPTAAPRLGSAPADHSKEFYQAYNEMLATLLPASPPVVSTPLIDLSFAEIVKLGQRLRVPLDATWSCLAASQGPCGRCAGCRTRAIGFLQAGVADPSAPAPR